MKEYNKPLIDVVREAAEGVYATSGTGGLVCKSVYMQGVFQEDDVNNVTTMKAYYGCVGCNLWRGVGADGINRNHCAIEANADYDQASQALTYLDGANMPRWEREGKVDTDSVEGFTDSFW